MKVQHARIGFRKLAMTSLVPLAVAGLALMLTAPVTVASVTMSDSNTTAVFNVGSEDPTGMVEWTVDGINRLYRQWFWYRVGTDGPEHPLEDGTVETVSYTPLFPDMLRVKYTKAGEFVVDITYNLVGSQPGSGQANMGEQIRVNNLKTSGSLDFHLFQYSDFDLDPQGQDTLTIQDPGQFYYADQRAGSLILAETIVTPAANHGEAGIYPATLNKLNDGLPTTLSGQVGPIVGDATWAFQWDTQLGPGGSFVISKLKAISPIPEPATLTFLALGGLVVLVRRGRK